MTWWSNCLIEGIKQKLKDWGNIQLKPFFCIDGKPWRFHLMWLDKRAHCVKHFTHKGIDGRHSDLFFRGRYMTMTIEQFNSWCQKKGKLNLAIAKSRGNSPANKQRISQDERHRNRPSPPVPRKQPRRDIRQAAV